MKKSVGGILIIPLPVAAFSAMVAYAGEAPYYQNRSLTIPRVDTELAIGQYQNAILRLAADGRWDLVSVSETKRAAVDQVNIRTVGTKPVQVFVTATGWFPTPCYSLGSAYARRDSEQFDIMIAQIELQTFVACAQVPASFSTTFPLDVYGIPAGTYNVRINGKTASFVLTEQNVLPP